MSHRLLPLILFFLFFFFNDTATTEIYTLSLHDALPILPLLWPQFQGAVLPSKPVKVTPAGRVSVTVRSRGTRSEEHTSELQSQSNLVCRLLLEKKKKKHAGFEQGEHILES